LLRVPSPASLRAAIKISLAAALAGAWALNFRQVEFAWYPLLAVVMCMDETDTRVVAAARARVLGTIAAGLVSFLVHTMLEGWIGLTVALLVVVPVLRICRWQAGLGTAVVVSSMLFLVARYSALDWIYVLNRTVDTLVGVGATLVVNLLFWPIHRLQEMRGLDRQLRRLMASRLTAIQQQLKGPHGTPTPSPEPQALVGSRLCQQLRQLVNDELRSNPEGEGQRQHWRQRSLLWERINHHSLQLQRLALMLPQGVLATEPTPWLERLPALLQAAESVVAPLPHRTNLAGVARARGLQPLLLLAIDDELRRLTHSAQSLALASRRDPAPR
jgi:uncharacterized membrane protein YccC